MKAFLSVLILLSLLLPAICYAEWEYITHGGYDAAVGAWTRTALIFSDSNYKGLFISAIVLGAIAIFVATYVRAATGAKAGGLSWATPVLAGMAIYVAFIAPKDKLIIYDELFNRGPQEVGGIPLILATSAGILNKIEKGFTDIISTSTDPASDYRMNAGGTGWSLLDAVTPASVLPPNPYSTVQRFIKDCVYPELIRDGTVLDINKIARGEQKYDVVITESANPALYTVVYTDNGAGTTKTCYDAAPDVALILGNPTYGDLALKTICASKGFNTSGPSLNVCKNLIDSILTTTFPGSTGGNISFGVFLAQKVLADAFMQVAEQSSPSVAITTLATSQTQSQFIGLGLHANTWIPVLKESLTAVAISITPLLLLFAATPLASRALSLVFGMFVWLTMWGIIDAVIHAFGVDLAKQASQTIQAVSGDMGFTAMLMWPSYTAKVAATFGALRWSGLMLASVISGMLVKFGSTALAMLAGSISAMPQSSGAAYGGTGLRNMGGVVNSEIMPTQTWANASIVAGGVNNLTRGLVQKQAGEMAGGARFGNELGMAKIAQATRGSLLGSAASGIGTGMAYDRYGLDNAITASANQQARSIGTGLGYGSMDKAHTAGQFSAKSELGTVSGVSRVMQALGFGNNVERFKTWETSGKIATREMLPYLHKAGFKGIKEGMRIDYGVDENGNLRYLTGVSQDGKESITYGDGKIVQKRVLTGEELKLFAEEARKAGFVNVANGLTKAMNEGKAVDFTIVRDAETEQIASIQAGHYGNFTQEDFRRNLKGWENINKALAATIVGSYTEVHHGEVRHYMGTGYDMPQYSDFFEAVVHNDATTFHKNYGGLMWSSRQAREAMVVAFAKQLEQFGDLKALLNKAMQAGIKISPAGPAGKFLSAAGVEISVGGEIQSADKFDANKLLFELQKNAHGLAGNTYLNSLQKSKAFVEQGHELVELFRKTAELSVPQRLVGRKGTMGSTPVVVDLPDQNM